jgi:hypothetical protein
MSAPTWCKDCNKPIRWYKTVNGKSMPVNADPVTDGNVVIEAGRARVLQSGETYAGRRFVSHFKTCPFASKRREQKAKDAAAAQESPSDAHEEPQHPDGIVRAIRLRVWHIHNDRAPKATAYISLAAGVQALQDLGVPLKQILEQAERAGRKDVP